MPQKVIELLKNAAQANLSDPFRKGNIVTLPPEGSLVVAGDIHGHQRNFERIVKFADLDNNPQTHLILQEIIHGGQEDQQGGCLSYKLIFQAAELKLKFPDRVHFLMGNHDTAFLTGGKVLKNGKEMNLALECALKNQYGHSCAEVTQSLKDFLFSQPLAAKTKNRIWLSHSLPANRYAPTFDYQIFQRPLTLDDLQKPGSAYTLTWGREHSKQTLDTLAAALDVDFFILGHQTQPAGFAKLAENLIILASEHAHGHIIKFDLKTKYTIDELLSLIIPLASIA